MCAQVGIYLVVDTDSQRHLCEVYLLPPIASLSLPALPARHLPHLLSGLNSNIANAPALTLKPNGGVPAHVLACRLGIRCLTSRVRIDSSCPSAPSLFFDTQLLPRLNLEDPLRV